MRRRLLNQTEGDPAASAIAARDARTLNDVVRFGFQQPEIVGRRDRERVTRELKELTERPQRIENDGAGTDLQGPNSGMSSRAEGLPPSPPAPRPKLRLKKLGEE